MQTSRLDHQLQSLLGQSMPWADQRHLQTLIWADTTLMRYLRDEWQWQFATPTSKTWCFLSRGKD